MVPSRSQTESRGAQPDAGEGAGFRESAKRQAAIRVHITLWLLSLPNNTAVRKKQQAYEAHAIGRRQSEMVRFP